MRCWPSGAASDLFFLKFLVRSRGRTSSIPSKHGIGVKKKKNGPSCKNNAILSEASGLLWSPLRENLMLSVSKEQLPPSVCGLRGPLSGLSVTHFPPLSSGKYNSTHLTGVSQGLDEHNMCKVLIIC